MLILCFLGRKLDNWRGVAYFSPMRFHEKLRRRVAQLGLNKAKAARSVGLPESTISNYLVKEESLPRIDIASKIARAIQVSLEWLADDSAGWPPPDAGDPSATSQLSDRQLMLEVGKRHRLAELRLLDALDSAEKIDWKAVRPEDFGRVAPLVAAVVYSTHVLNLYSAHAAARENHAVMPGAGRGKEDFDIIKIAERVNSIHETEGFKAIAPHVLMSIPSRDLAAIEHDLAWAGAREQNLSTQKPEGSQLKKQADTKTEKRHK